MTEVKLTKENVSEAYKVADDKVKRVLDALFGKAKIRPTLDDYTTIRTYEDACEALGEDEIDEECLHEAGCPNHIIALMKLERISKALWGRNFEPIPDAEGRKYFYYPYFCLYTQDEMKNMSADDCGALLAAAAYE